MKWIHNFQLFLFDFDGLLVNTEHLHYQAYVNALAQRGLSLSLSLADFYRLAQFNATAWREALLAEIPTLDWDPFYKEKKKHYLSLLETKSVEWMPGVEPLLLALQKADIRRCVVTHSPREQTLLIKKRLPLLDSIPHWITREDYEKPKPDPECYLRAISLYGKKGDRIVGFEDSIRGIRALSQTSAEPIFICPEPGNIRARHFPSLSVVDLH
jgi:HAD superfamily hydrolase (TIGR01509 family)